MVETGHFALVLAFALSLVQMLVPLVGARTGNQRLMAVDRLPRFLAVVVEAGGRHRRLELLQFRGAALQRRAVVPELAFVAVDRVPDHRHARDQLVR